MTEAPIIYEPFVMLAPFAKGSATSSNSLSIHSSYNSSKLHCTIERLAIVALATAQGSHVSRLAKQQGPEIFRKRN